MANHNGISEIGLTRPVPDALSLEYKRDYGTAIGNLDVADLVNNPAANRVCRVLGLGLTEQGAGLLGTDVRAFGDDLTDTVLVAPNAVQPLK